MVISALLNGSTRSQVAKLTASDAAIDDEFGRSVAISGETIVVGSVEGNDNTGFGQYGVGLRVSERRRRRDVAGGF